nr:aminopeptidase [Candidatus Sigynarchaeota archaeon]
GGAGQDDGSCSYLSLRAILDLNGGVPRTVGTILFDKEETGSDGATGAQSVWIQQVFNDLMVRVGIPETRVNLDACLSNTKMLSADVSAAMDPSFASVHDPRNAPIFGKGLVVEKYTGHGGKSGTSEATAEFMALVLSILEKAQVPHQVGSLGAVDIGGGGTIAKFFASAFNCDVVDMGVALLNMHSPFEVSHIADLYSGYLGYKAFFTEP